MVVRRLWFRLDKMRCLKRYRSGTYSSSHCRSILWTRVVLRGSQRKGYQAIQKSWRLSTLSRGNFLPFTNHAVKKGRSDGKLGNHKTNLLLFGDQFYVDFD